MHEALCPKLWLFSTHAAQGKISQDSITINVYFRSNGTPLVDLKFQVFNLSSVHMCIILWLYQPIAIARSLALQ